jgi:hypothetical protein
MSSTDKERKEITKSLVEAVQDVTEGKPPARKERTKAEDDALRDSLVATANRKLKKSPRKYRSLKLKSKNEDAVEVDEANKRLKFDLGVTVQGAYKAYRDLSDRLSELNYLSKQGETDNGYAEGPKGYARADKHLKEVMKFIDEGDRVYDRHIHG